MTVKATAVSWRDLLGACPKTGFYEDHLEPKIMPVTESGCWLWIGAQSTRGYGRIQVRKSQRQAHRVVYETLVGPVDPKLHLDHLCRVKFCVNPAHLEPVSARVNVVTRGTGPTAEAARKTHCLRGHELKGENIRVTQVGQRTWRKCRECERLAGRMFYWRHKTPGGTAEAAVDVGVAGQGSGEA